MSYVLEARGVRKHYIGGDGSRLDVLQGIDLAVSRGEFVAIIGASGCGKSTLLQLLGGLDEPAAGEILVDGASLGGLDPALRARVRNTRVGFVFQFHHLLRDFTARENVMMPLLVGGISEAEAAAKADAMLDQLGLADRRQHAPGMLSGGEQQRVAVARALVTEPAVVLADEPSGNLDHGNGERLHDLLASVARGQGQALVAVTHNRLLAARADQVYALEDGRLRRASGLEGLT